MNGCWPSSFDIAWNWIDPAAPWTLVTPQPSTASRPGSAHMPEWHCFAKVRGFLTGNPNDQILVFFFLRQALALPFSDFLLPWTWCRASSANLPEWSPLRTLVPRAPCTPPVSWGPSGLLPWGSVLLLLLPLPGLTFHPMQCLQNALNPSQLVPNQTIPQIRSSRDLCCFLGAPCDPELFPWFFPCLLWFILHSIGNRFLGQAATKNNFSDSLLFAN